MNDDAGPVYRATAGNRTAAWIVLVAAAGAVVWAIVSTGFPSPKAVALTGVFALIAFLAAGALRFQVRAEPGHLVVCWGGPVRRIPWSQIKSFGIGERAGPYVYIVLADKQKKRLPLTEVSNRQTSPDEVRDALQRYWKTHRR
jgi:hypothetical protein